MRRALTRSIPAAAVRTPRSAPAFRMAPSSPIRRLHATALQLKPATALAFDAKDYPNTHEKIQDVQDTPYFIDNKFLKSDATVSLFPWFAATPCHECCLTSMHFPILILE